MEAVILAEDFENVQQLKNERADRQNLTLKLAMR
jgi:hypothetical protein